MKIGYGSEESKRGEVGSVSRRGGKRVRHWLLGTVREDLDIAEGEGEYSTETKVVSS